MTTVEILTKARTAMLRNEPFFGVLALRLEIVEDPTCDTMWTDGRTLGCNPDFLSRLTFEETVGVIAHEVLHSAMGHTYRRGTRDRHTWNEAADYTINGTLREAGFTLPAGGYYNRTFSRMTPRTSTRSSKRTKAKRSRIPATRPGAGRKGKAMPGKRAAAMMTGRMIPGGAAKCETFRTKPEARGAKRIGERPRAIGKSPSAKPPRWRPRWATG